MLTRHDVKELVIKAIPQLQELKKTYSLLPKTICSRRVECCSMLPEISFLEALSALNQLMYMEPGKRVYISKKISRYFFLNPVEITLCPFLEKNDCIIYDNRFFACRAYGLWSKEYYEQISERSHDIKNQIRKLWGRMGITLPQEVMDFQVPYCTNVKTEGSVNIDDKLILQVEGNIKILSQQFPKEHHLFGQMYFSDFSFLFVSFIFGVDKAVSLKFFIVNDIVKTGNRARLDDTMREIFDIFGEKIGGVYEE